MNRYSRALPILLMIVNGVMAQELQQPISFSGFIDAYYSKNFNEPASRVNALRNFDIAEHQFVLSLAEIAVQKKTEPVGFRIDADFGTANDVVQAGIVSTTLPFLQQAYLTAVLPIGSGLTLDAGKFVSHMGYEVIESKDNWNYSRSFLFAWAVPYYHTGIRLSYPVAENCTATFHVVNGWNSVVDNNGFATIGATVSYAPVAPVNITFNVINGSEDLIVSPSLFETGKKNVVDITVVWHPAESFSVGVNADYGEARTNSGLGTWKGAAAYSRYAIDATSAAALRGEVFDDPFGYATGTGVKHLNLKEITGTYECSFATSLIIRVEARHDFSNAPVFDKKMTTASERSQTSVLVSIISIF